MLRNDVNKALSTRERKIEYTKPAILDLGLLASTQGAAGCSPGTADSGGCSTGDYAQGEGCFTGNDASGDDCHTGNNPDYYCSAGSGASG